MLRLAKPTQWVMLFWRGNGGASGGLACGVGPFGQSLEVDVDASSMAQYAGATVVEAPVGSDDENFAEVMELQRAVRLQNDVPIAARCAAEIEFYRGRQGVRIGVVSNDGSVSWTA